jgi:hypothetical protein
MTQKNGSLEVIFSGVSTHFRNGIVAGIKHRAVLPAASGFLVDSVYIDGFKDPFLYYLNPHFAQIELHDKKVKVDLAVPGLLTKNGHVLSGVRLQIGNGIPPKHAYETRDVSMNKLITYYPSYEYSADVVVGGRAACYFDFDYGAAKWYPATKKHRAPRFSMVVETDGPPWLLATPLNVTADAPSFKKLPLGGARHVKLYVKNLESPLEERLDQNSGQFDFLLHFLTSRGGIPKRIVATTPGLDNPRSTDPAQIGIALRRLGDLLLLQADDPTRFYRELLPPDFYGQTPACSPAQYG